MTDPLALFGTTSVGRAGGRLPMTITGAAEPLPVRYATPVPSAQVKSAVLLCRAERTGPDRGDRGPRLRATTPSGWLAGFGAEITTEVTGEGRVIHPDRPARAENPRPSPCRAIRPRRLSPSVPR